MLHAPEKPAQESTAQGADDRQAATFQEAEPRGPGQPAARRVAVTDSVPVVGYANFCAVQRTAEEVLLDFGISLQRFGQQQSIQITQRMALTYPTAKRLLDALRMAFERPEAAGSNVERSGANRNGS